MTPTKPGDYAFDPKSLIEIRKKLKLSQTELSKLLGVPANTLYRWETAATSPDASSLASIYSIALARGIRPDFFTRRTPVAEKTKGRHRLIVMWDFQNVGVSSSHVTEVGGQIRGSLLGKFSSTKQHLFKAFAHPDQSDATDLLSDLGWRVWEDDSDMDEEIIDQSRSDCGAEPGATILVLITRDGDYAEMIEELKTKGVRLYLMAPKEASEDLIEAVGKRRWILLDTKLSSQSARRAHLPVLPQPTPAYHYEDYDDDE
jgi:DNA-binding XRE family transcriptional regulator